MQLPHGEDASEHGLLRVLVQRGGREPQRAVGHAAALGQQVEHVGALLDRLRAERKYNISRWGVEGGGGNKKQTKMIKLFPNFNGTVLGTYLLFFTGKTNFRRGTSLRQKECFGTIVLHLGAKETC